MILPGSILEMCQTMIEISNSKWDSLDRKCTLWAVISKRRNRDNSHHTLRCHSSWSSFSQVIRTLSKIPCKLKMALCTDAWPSSFSRKIVMTISLSSRPFSQKRWTAQETQKSSLVLSSRSWQRALLNFWNRSRYTLRTLSCIFTSKASCTGSTSTTIRVSKCKTITSSGTIWLSDNISILS